VTPVDALTAAWTDLWAAELRYKMVPGCCIVATRVGVLALRQHGQKAWPVATVTSVFNRPGDELARAGVPTEQWPEHAWSISAGPGTPTTPTASGQRGYGGHLWIGTDHELIDLSASQFHRPGRINMPGPQAIPGMGRWERNDGLIVWVQPNPDRSYRTSMDWRCNWQPILPKILDRMAVALS
jgi:hypothetical protein